MNEPTVAMNVGLPMEPLAVSPRHVVGVGSLRHPEIIVLGVGARQHMCIYTILLYLDLLIRSSLELFQNVIELQQGFKNWVCPPHAGRGALVADRFVGQLPLDVGNDGPRLEMTIR